MKVEWRTYLIGGGGHAKVVADMLTSMSTSPYCLVLQRGEVPSSFFSGIAFVYDDELLETNPSLSRLYNGIGSLPGSRVRCSIFNQYSQRSFLFPELVSAAATCVPSAKLSRGVQVMDGAIIHADTTVGENSIVNTGAILEHDCMIGSNCHIAPSATICGGVLIGDGVHVGTGANIIQGVQVGDRAVIGAGAIVTRDVLSDAVVYPARSYTKNHNE
ncbi:acetyltransferase [Marinagarivorans algicola]|uniref:acetyltransferase n=1 Tax=Marinagarivorans algicola TaxID=1513270 RepID=UPI0006B57039|nr:acetyltransferase [Marinagarivorans algicola]